MAHFPPKGGARPLRLLARIGVEPALRKSDLQRLLHLVRGLSVATEHAELASIAAAEVLDLTGARWVSIRELLRDRELALVAMDGPGDGSGITASLAEWQALLDAAPVWDPPGMSPTEPRPVHDGEPSRPPGGRGTLCLPLAAAGVTFGVLSVRLDAAACERHRSLLVAMAEECSRALARGAMFTRVRAEAEAAEGARFAVQQRLIAAERLTNERTWLYERERFARARSEAADTVVIPAFDLSDLLRDEAEPGPSRPVETITEILDSALREVARATDRLAGCPGPDELARAWLAWDLERACAFLEDALVWGTRSASERPGLAAPSIDLGMLCQRLTRDFRVVPEGTPRHESGR